MPARSKWLFDVVTYVGGIALVTSMLMDWPAPGRRGSDSGIRLIGRISRLARFAGVERSWLIGPLWFLVPLCGALLMLLTALDRTWARRGSLVLVVLTSVELIVLFHVFGVIGLDRSAGAGFGVASTGAGLCLIGTVGAIIGRRVVGRAARERTGS